jgi:hypothetical protein
MEKSWPFRKTKNDSGVSSSRGSKKPQQHRYVLVECHGQMPAYRVSVPRV